MMTHDEHEIDAILKHKKIDIARMLVNVQRDNAGREKQLRSEIAILEAELAGRDKVFKLLELMAGESNLGLKIQR